MSEPLRFELSYERRRLVVGDAVTLIDLVFRSGSLSVREDRITDQDVARVADQLAEWSTDVHVSRGGFERQARKLLAGVLGTASERSAAA